MTTQYFMPNVADAWLYDMEDNLVLVAKTLLDTTFDFTTQATDVRGGKGNPLLYVHFSSPEGTVALSDAQFNLEFLASTVGSSLATGTSVYTEENVTLTSGGAGTVTGTPLGIQSSTLYGWITHDGVDAVERVTFTGSNFTSSVGSEDDVVCVRYFETDAAAKLLTVYANVVPDTLRLVLDADLAEKSDDSAGIVGRVQIIVPKFQLDGNFNLALTPDAVATTPVNGRTISSEGTASGCSNNDILATITRIVDGALWYATVTGLSILGGDFGLTHPDTHTLVVMAIHSDGTTSYPPVADLTFSSGTVGTATVGAQTGLVTTVAAGTTLLSVTITAATEYDASVTLTVS